MNINVITQIGKTKYNFHIEEQKEIEALHKAAVLGNPPLYCNECQNDQFFALDSNKDKDGNTYVNIVCKKCFAKAKLGQYRAGGYFWRRFKKYEREPREEIEVESSEGI